MLIWDFSYITALHSHAPLHSSFHPSIHLSYHPAAKPCNPCVCPMGERSCQQPALPHLSVYSPPPLSSVHCALIKGRLCEHPTRQSHTVAPTAASLTSDNSKLQLRFGLPPLNLVKVKDWSLGCRQERWNRGNLLLVLSGRAARSGEAGAHMAQKTRFSRCRQSRL